MKLGKDVWEVRSNGLDSKCHGIRLSDNVIMTSFTLYFSVKLIQTMEGEEVGTAILFLYNSISLSGQ